jgi:hypothetical protein
MVSAGILAFGIILIFEALFISLDAFNYYSHYLKISQWIEEKVWEAGNELAVAGPKANIAAQGALDIDGKAFEWSVSYSPVDAVMGLYRLSCSISWPESKRQVRLSRDTYVFYQER